MFEESRLPQQMKNILMDKSKAHIEGTLIPKAPRQAATIILVRDSDFGLQTYLLKRSSKSKFFPASYVFPGGVLDEEDRDILFWKDHIDLNMDEVLCRFGGNDLSGEDVLPYCVAGIRETFEEAGAFIIKNQPAPSYERACRERLSGGLKNGWLKGFVLSSDCTLSLTSLSRWSHWITPKLMKYHFDTLFFVAIMPELQSCTPDRMETDEGIWISPREALAANLEATIPLTPPTIVTMHELLDYPDVASLKTEWETRQWGEARLPRMVQSEAGAIIIEPWDPEYPDIERSLSTEVYETLVHSGVEPFSRLWLHDGIWKPIGLSQK
jgi:8-oxo-dGTP pyrophosphatase MutT (NUDIX family)